MPLRTDAAINYRPWGTAAVILANVAVVVFMGFPEPVVENIWGEPTTPPLVNSWVLEWGQFNPLTWVTSVFVHAGWIHLIGNMIFLWIFGLVVEGSIGWRRFLPLYLVIAVGQCGLEQVLMIGEKAGGSVGASAAITGLMAISGLWSPKNRIKLFLWIINLIWTVEVSVLGFCLLWIGLDVLWVLIGMFRMSTALLHVMGAAIGLGAGVLMLKQRWVDCEGWDYLSLRAKRLAAARRERTPVVPTAEQKKAEDRRTLLHLRESIEQRDAFAADEIYEHLQQANPGWVLPRPELLELIQILLRARNDERAFARMEEFLRSYPEKSESVRLTLANNLVQARRPTRALELLSELDDEFLTGTQRRAKAEIEAKARVELDRPGLELE